MDGTIGVIKPFAGSFAPSNWAFCNGQLLPINQFQALFAILGTNYGGDGIRTFGLPDLRGRAAVDVGQGTGLSVYVIGQQTGNAVTALTGNQLPAHNHTVAGTIAMGTTNLPANSETPVGNYFANDGSTRYDTQNDGVTMKPANVSLLANNINNNPALNNMMPYLCITYIICLFGIFPSRN